MAARIPGTRGSQRTTILTTGIGTSAGEVAAASREGIAMRLQPLIPAYETRSNRFGITFGMASVPRRSLKYRAPN